MRTSIRQVAERAQVSPMTVSRVLRGRHDKVQEETRQRVLEAVRELDYVPVRPATQNRHVETHAIGLVPYYLDAARNEIDSRTYAGVCQQAHKHGYDLLVMLRDEADWMDGRKAARFLDRRSDGFLFISPVETEWTEALEALVEHRIPTVVCYRRDVPEGVAWVTPDNEAIVRLAVDLLWGRGHRRLAYLAGPAMLNAEQPRLTVARGLRSADDLHRERAFRQLTGNSGDEVVYCLHADWQLESGVLEEILRRGVTGVVCVNDYLALQLRQQAEAAGLRVPRDLSIVGIDDSPAGAALGLTSISFGGYDEVGRCAVDAWMGLRQGRSAAKASRALPATLVDRETVAAPRG